MRIIDADALKEKAWDADTRCGYVQVVDVGDIDDAPTIEPEPCEDAVSRSDLLHIFEEQSYPVRYDCNSIDMGMTLPGIVEVLNIAPSVTPQPKTGKWIAIVAELGDHKIIVEGYNCSKCGRYDAEKDNFCPDCGARMEGVE